MRVSVTVQVVDVEPRVLELSLPAYLPSVELGRRIVRDAGLSGEVALRARGRTLAAPESLGEAGVQSGDWVFLLPVVPADAPVVDGSAPAEEPVATSGWPELGALVGYAAAWAVAEVGAPWPMLSGLVGAGFGALAARWAHAVWPTSAAGPALVLTLGVTAWMHVAMWMAGGATGRGLGVAVAGGLCGVALSLRPAHSPPES